MESNGNQRKKIGRPAKSGNNECMGPPQQVSEARVVEVSALATSPNPEGGSANNAPAAECRRSSRKKIIKFDVRDLLNKNRKPHKIQIEARIDSNAPTTSKTSMAAGGELTSSTSTFMSGDLLSKQKTFLEKSAIFRRYSISQEPKPPPPKPLPLPLSLLGKVGDNKDVAGAGGTTSRRLSRTQEFFSNAMIKPKQTTSLIVAQMESSAPSMAGKRKSLYKSMETEPSISESADAATLQKRRGRSSRTTSLQTSSKEVTNTKKLTPEKATNWKEYKACLAQQTGSKDVPKPQVNIKKTSVNSSESPKADEVFEISSSSSQNSNIEESKDMSKQPEDIKNSLVQEQHKVKTKRDTLTKFNLLAEIVIEDSNSNDCITEKLDCKDSETDKERIKDKNLLKAETQISSKKSSKVNPEYSLDKETDIKKFPTTVENKIEEPPHEKQQEDNKNSDFNDNLEMEKVTSSTLSNIKETIQKRRQTKLNESLQKSMDPEGNISPPNLDNSLQEVKCPKSLQSSKEQAIGKRGQNKKCESLEEGKVSKVTDVDKKILTMLDDCKQNKMHFEEKKRPTILDDAILQESDSKEQPKHEESLPNEIVDSNELQEASRIRRSKLNESPLEEPNFKASQLTKEQKNVKRSQTKPADSLQKETDPKDSISTQEEAISSSLTIPNYPLQVEKNATRDQSLKEQTIVKKVQTKPDDLLLEISQSNKGHTTSSTSKTTMEDSQQEETDSKILESTKEELVTTTSNKKKVTRKGITVQMKHNYIESSADEEFTNQTKNKDYIQEEQTDSNKLETTKVELEATPSNNRKLTKKDISAKKEKNTDEEEKYYDNLSENSAQTKTKDLTQEIIMHEQPTHGENAKDLLDKKEIEDKSNQLKPTDQANNELQNDLSSSIKELQNDKITANLTQIVQENPPNLKIPTKPSTSSLNAKENSLSEPSTPSEEKYISFSRTSSSSESENQSEHSSYSSATSSTSTSTSTRSYKSGDKLRVSIKRFSALQSPSSSSSSSSQSSPSEEQNSPSVSDVNTKKSPTAKRSKRLQTKFVKMMENQATTENIDDCFQKILTDEKEELQITNKTIDIIELEFKNVDEKVKKVAAEEIKEIPTLIEISSPKSGEKKKDITTLLEATSQTRNKDVSNKESHEIINDDKPMSSSLQKEQIKDLSTEESTTSNDLHEEIKPTTSKGKNGKGNFITMKRKSLRNRKENEYEEQDQETKDSVQEADEIIKEIDLQERKSLRNRNFNVTKEKDQETKEKVHDAEGSSKHTELQEQQIKLCEIVHESDKSEFEEQPEKLSERKQQSKNNLKEQIENQNDEIQKQHAEQKEKLESNIVELEDKKQQEKTKLKEQEELLAEEKLQQKRKLKESPVPPEKGTEEKIQKIDLKSQEKDNNDNPKTEDDKEKELVLTDPAEVEDKIITKPNKLINDTKVKKSSKILTYKSKELEDIQSKAIEVVDTESSKSATQLNEYSEHKGNITLEKLSDINSSCKADISEFELSKFILTENKTDKDKTTSVKAAESHKSTTKSLEITKPDIDTSEKISKVEISSVEIEEISEEQSLKTFSKKTNAETTTNATQKKAKTLFTKSKEEINSVLDKEGTTKPLTQVIEKKSFKSKEESEYLTLPTTFIEDTTCAPEVNKQLSPKPKAKPDMEKPSSAKRKSLRNQKEKTSEDITVPSLEINEQSKNIIEEPISSLNPIEEVTEKEKKDKAAKASIDELIKVPAKRGRKSRFKNLHGPETESETDSSTGKQTPIEETMLAERKNDQTPIKDIFEEPILTLNTQEISSIVNIKESLQIPKRRGRKSRFKNLHGPEPESETDSSTGKQTPIEEAMFGERKDDQTPSPIENEKKIEVNLTKDNKTDKIAELGENNVKETSVAIKEDLKAIKSLTNIASKTSKDVPLEKDEIIKSVTNEKYHTKEVVTLDTASVPEKSEEPVMLQTAAPESYLIQNVSIETNTLLDILRTVQSNTAAAALEANKFPADIKKTDSTTEETSAIDENKTLIETDNSKTRSEDLPNISLESIMTLKSLKKLETDSSTNSPTRSDNASPLTLKKVAISPTRTDSSSPLTLKKVCLSPTRSDTSSPLTLQKVTRRYERRSRRGDESAHKTLEETFAEIAAQSSKAVLAAKSFDSNKEFTVGEKEGDSEKIQTEFVVESFVETAKEDKLSMEVLEKMDNIEKTPVKVTETIKENPSVEVPEEVENIENTSFELPEKQKDESKSKDNEKSSEDTIMESSESNVSEREPQTLGSCKVTPARRGRKPKNRAIDVLSPITKEIEIKNLPKTKKDIEKSTVTSLKDKEHEEASQKQELFEETKSIKEKLKNTIDTTIDFPQPEISKEGDTKLPKDDTKQQDFFKEFSELPQTQENPSKSEADNGKSAKKSIKKRDTSKELPTSAEGDISLLQISGKSKDDDIRTPKQAAKKRDSSLTKSETKSITKKSTKKNKNNEEEPTAATQKDDITSKTTTPPPKRGRKPKTQQEPAQPTTSSKKKNKKEAINENIDDDNLEEKRKDLESESESLNSSLDKSLDEKIAKKKRQRKLKEDFEAALAEDLNKNKDNANTDTVNSISSFGLTLLNKSPPPAARRDSFISESIRVSCSTPVDQEEDPDPLKDIEKFIADGVNLLKKDYKLDENSVDDVITTTSKTNETEDSSVKTSIEEDKTIYNIFETPADTPSTTPSVTPPPKSPTSVESTPDESSGVRRSHRIKLITQTPKALVGRGLVRDKERFSIKDDVETKSHYTLDDHLMDLAEVEAKNAKFLKEMEERLSNFQVIKENEYLCERVISREARKMICDCFLTHEEEERGELGCGEDCLNRLLMIECGPECNVKERCTNNCFQKLLCSPCRVFRTEKKGFGIMADIEILPGEFIMEYVGEVIDTDIFEQRRILYSQDKNRHYYFMALRSDAIIDATIKGNISRFINHSCDPNAETQKWTVNGELRIGFFSRKSIMPGEEITFNYQYQRYGRAAQRCYCESSNCRGWIGQEPTSDEGEQIDDDEEESEDDDDEEMEEEQDTSNLLVHDDDEDSDASVTDPEEVQKKLEMAAAQAEVELAPLSILEETVKPEESLQTDTKETDDSVKTENEEDSKSKFKKLLTKMAEKVAAKQKQNKREQKMQRKKKSKESSADLTSKLRFLEDPDIEDEVEFLRECGLKNQSDTLRLSRLMVRAKLVQTRLNLLDILRKGDLPCRRLFLDYHGLRLVHGWMSEDAGNMQIRLALLQTLETLPIANKTVLTDSKVMQMVRNWCGSNAAVLSPNEDSSSSNSNSQDNTLQPNTNLEEGTDLQELQKLALKLITTWEGLPEIFRIPKKERIEQMKEHEREADRQYAANAETEENKTSSDRYRRNRFGIGSNSTTTSTTTTSTRFTKPNNGNPLRTSNTTPENMKSLSKAQRREMFAAKVARDEAEKRMAEERREFETKCRFFGLDPKKTRTQDVPFCVNPATGQWYSIERKPINTPPSYAHVQVPVKPKSTDPNDYQLPAVCSSLPAQWKYAITPQGKIYYYHIKFRIPQWEPPTPAQLQLCEMEDEEVDSESEHTTTAGEDSSEDDDEILIGMDAVQLRAYIDRKVETRRQKRYQRLVDQRAISPRREEDRVYNQIEVRKYKENKEKIRKRKEEIRRKRAEVLRQSSLNMCTLGSIMDTSALKIQTESDEELGVLPIQDYLLSSDEEVDLKAEVNSPLLDKIVEGDKIVDELDALTSKRQLKRPLPPHRDLNEPSTSTSAIISAIERQEYKKRKLEKKDKRKPKDQDAKYRKNKEKFRCEIAGIIVHHLKPYRRDSCTIGRIKSNEDFNHLARKLTHFVVIKELKYCESVGQTLVVTESVKNKSREFIKKYMAKYDDFYIKPSNDPDFKDIPFTL